jgi:hypothetical protein
LVDVVEQRLSRLVRDRLKDETSPLHRQLRIDPQKACTLVLYLERNIA